MSIAIGKVLGGIAVSGGGIVAITGTTLWLNNSDKQATKLDTENNNNNIFIYTISDTVTDYLASTEISTDNKNYQCKFGGQNHECEITASEVFDTTTKQWSIDKIATDAVTGAATIAKETLKTKDNIYKIKINKDIGDWTKEKEKFSIDIIPNKLNKATDKSKKYASLKPLFAINSDDSINEHTKTKYFVVKNKTTTVGSNSTTATYTCLTSETVNADETGAASCNVYDFSSTSNTKLHELVFAKPTTPIADIGSLTTNKYYLVKLGTPVKTNEVQHIQIKPSVGDVASLESEIIPAIRDKEDGDNIFILKKADVTDQQASGVGS